MVLKITKCRIFEAGFMVEKLVIERGVLGLLLLIIYVQPFLCHSFAIDRNSQHVITTLVVCWELDLISNPASE